MLWRVPSAEWDATQNINFAMFAALSLGSLGVMHILAFPFDVEGLVMKLGQEAIFFLLYCSLNIRVNQCFPNQHRYITPAKNSKKPIT